MGQKKSASASLDIAENDARGMEINAGQQRSAAQIRAEQEREKVDRLISEQRARFASSGGGMDGSAAEVMGETAAKGKLNSDLRLWEGEEAARGAESQASLKRYAAKAGRSGDNLQMASTILTGIGSMAGTAYKAGITGQPKYAYGDDMGWKTTVKYG